MIRTVYRSEDFAVRDRFDAWQSVSSRSIMPMTLSRPDPAGFTARVRQADVGAVWLSELLFSAHDAARTPALVRRFDPEVYTVVLTLRGGAGLSQAGRGAVFGARDLLVYDSSLPFTAEVGGGTGRPAGLTEMLLLHVPKALMPLPATAVEPLLARRLPGRQGLPAVVADTLQSVLAQAAHCTEADAARLGTIALDLVTALVAHHLDGPGPPRAGSRQGALLLTIEAFIQQHLADPALTPGSVAAAHHISVRYLHRLFEQRDTTVAAFIRARRLDRARRDLADPALGDLAVGAVAARWGFATPADFSRAFRTAYGTSPRDYRAAALRQ